MNLKRALPRVSVITATYKKFDRLYETIESVFLQDYDNIEYIICDDGSDNFPEEEIKNFIEKNNEHNITVRVICNKTNLGTVKNLNNAYKQSHGDYIVNLSAGDVFFSTDTLSRIAKRFVDTGCKVMVTTRILYHGDFKPICFLPHYQERKIIHGFKDNKKQYSAFIASRYYNMASGSAMYFTRDIMEEFGFYDERYVLWEDGPFLAKYLYKYPLEFAYDITSTWYETGGVSSGKKTQHPLLTKDIKTFNKVERPCHISELGFADRRRLEFILSKEKVKNLFDKFVRYMVFFPEASFYFVMNKKRKKRRKKDMEIISDMVKNHKCIAGILNDLRGNK